MTAWTRPEAVAYQVDRAFEGLVNEKMLALGWNCEILRAADNFGADIICTKRGEKAIVQSAVGARIDMGDVQHAAAVKAYHSADLVLIVHNGVPSANALAQAEAMGVTLVHVDELVVASAHDRSDYGVRLRLERELALEQQDRFRIETEKRLTLMAYYETVGAYDRESKAWEMARRRHPWVKILGVVAIAPPFLLLDTSYFLFFLAASLAFAAYAVFFSAPGAKPVAPPPLEDITAQEIIPERARPVPPRPNPDGRSASARVPAPASLVHPGTKRPAPIVELKSIVKCPKCHTKMRLPRGKRLWANCPSCKNKFRADT